MNYNEDDRAQRLFDIFPKVNGQINVSYVNSINHIVAWHKHKIQTDYWCCLKGSFKVGMAIPKEGGSHEVKFEYLSDKNFKILEMIPGVWHGYKAIEPGSILLYYLTEKYNPSDEIRCNPGDFEEEWETENR